MNLKSILFSILFLASQNAIAQLKWTPVDSINKNLPNGVRLYYTNDSLDGKPNIAYYIEADLKNKNLIFDVDTTLGRRLTPSQFYEKNKKPVVVVNGTFFNFTKNQNLNVIIKNGNVVAHNIKAVQRKNADSVMVNIPIYRSAIGINKKRKADVAWISTDSNSTMATAKQQVAATKFKKWKMETAIGGGPTLITNGAINITNDAEQLFTGKKGLEEKHPRTAMGYTAAGKLIILVVQGRFANKAEGASLKHLARILQEIGCIEALNLDGGGSSCMLVNGMPTIQVSDKTGQRPIPGIFIIKTK